MSLLWVIPAAIIISNLIRHYNKQEEPQTDPIPVPVTPVPVPDRSENHSCNFMENWLRSNDFRYSDDSIPEAWRYRFGLTFENSIVDVWMMMNKEVCEFTASVHFPFIFNGFQFHRLDDYVKYFNDYWDYLQIECDKNKGVVRVKCCVPGEDILEMNVADRENCIRLLLSESEKVGTELLGLAYGSALTEMAVLRTMGMKKWAMN